MTVIPGQQARLEDCKYAIGRANLSSTHGLTGYGLQRLGAKGGLQASLPAQLLAWEGQEQEAGLRAGPELLLWLGNHW